MPNTKHCSGSSSHLAALAQDFVNLRNALLPHMAAFADGGQSFLQHLDEEFLDLDIA